MSSRAIDAGFVAEVEALRKTQWLAQRIAWFDEVGSTNEYAKRHAVDLPHGALVGANRQRAGRGTHGRVWNSESSQDLYFSLCLRATMQPEELPLLTLVTALTVAECFEAFGACASIKWPNDVLLSGKKASGILIETNVQRGRVSSAVVGIGINVGRTNFSESFEHEATSLAAVTGQPQDRARVLSEFLSRYEKGLCRSQADVITEVERRLAWRGEAVLLDHHHGTLLGLSRSGALRLETENGEACFAAGRLRRLETEKAV